jgi:hypothetical protein
LASLWHALHVYEYSNAVMHIFRYINSETCGRGELLRKRIQCFWNVRTTAWQVSTVRYFQLNMCFMVKWIKLKISWWSLTVLYSLTCCWLHVSCLNNKSYHVHLFYLNLLTPENHHAGGLCSEKQFFNCIIKSEANKVLRKGDLWCCDIAIEMCRWHVGVAVRAIWSKSSIYWP